MKNLSLFFLALLVAFTSVAQNSLDTTALRKIRIEGLENSGVEDIAFQIIDRAGPRLMNSPGYARAMDNAAELLKGWGVTEVEKQAFGEYGKGWAVDKSYIAMTEPYYMPFIAVPQAWTGSTDGLIQQKVIFPEIDSEEDFENYQGKLNGAIVVFPPEQWMLDSKGDTGPTFKADAARFTEEQLAEMENPIEQSGRWSPQRIMEWRAAMQMRQKRDSFLRAEKASLVLMGAVGKHGTLFTGSRRDGRLMETPRDLAVLDIAPEYFNLLKRFTDNGQAVTVEAEVQTTFYDEDTQGYNVIAEIPGTDKKLKDEIVMLGAHLDSWHGATGATDNGAGSVVMLEAMRILKAAGLQPKRTIRLGLWGGEEQGLHGSQNYVKNTFGDSETMKLTKAHGKFSAYYNIDNGTGRIRGIYLQGNENVGPIFEEWFQPFDDIIDNRTITIRNTGGTDHLAFDGVGLPGFQFIQDPVEYSTRTHHTNMDTYDRLVVDDLKQIATIVAAFVYNTAQREEKMPRKEEKLAEK